MGAIGNSYSTSNDAKKKKRIDEAILKQVDPETKKNKNIPIDIKNEAYLKALIDTCSKGASKLKGHAHGLQFFIVKGGAEGFLSDWYGDKDASAIALGGAATTSSSSGVHMTFDDNDLLIVFDKVGKLINAAPLRRPLEILGSPRVKWHEQTANAVYNAWDGQSVSLYHNTYFVKWGGIPYFGLQVDDKLGWYSSGQVRVDMHKEEATNGCIFIVDENTPAYGPLSKNALGMFEPQLIVDIQNKLGHKTADNIGIMHIIDVNDSDAK